MPDLIWRPTAMALIEMKAEFRCDGCGRVFQVNIDPAGAVSEGESAYDVAEDAARGSLGYKGPNNPDGTCGSSSVQDDQHLCGVCTSAADEKANEDDGTQDE